MPPRYRRDYLIQRAGECCEYCRFPQKHLSLGLYLDHIIARQHVDDDDEENLAMCCAHCSSCKGPNLASVDPETMQKVWLFNPRKDNWSEHFEVLHDEVVGKTPQGRATAKLLDMNNERNVVLRRLLRLLGEPVC